MSVIHTELEAEGMRMPHTVCGERRECMKTSKRVIAILLMAAMVLLLTVPAQAMPKATMTVGETGQLVVRNKRTGLIYTGKVKWSSSKKKVVYINKKTGEFVALKPGKTVITAKYKGKRLRYKFIVTP